MKIFTNSFQASIPLKTTQAAHKGGDGHTFSRKQIKDEGSSYSSATASFLHFSPPDASLPHILLPFLYNHHMLKLRPCKIHSQVKWIYQNLVKNLQVLA